MDALNPAKTLVCAFGEGHLYIDDGTGHCRYCTNPPPPASAPVLTSDRWPTDPRASELTPEGQTLRNAQLYGELELPPAEAIRELAARFPQVNGVDEGAGHCRYCTNPAIPTVLTKDHPERKPPTRTPMPALPTQDAARKRFEAWKYLTEYFPDSFFAEVEVAIQGNEQHNPGEPLHWARGKSMKQLECAFHHMWDHAAGTAKDTDGQYHLAKAIWRLKAELQLTIEADRAAGR